MRIFLVAGFPMGFLVMPRSLCVSRLGSLLTYPPAFSGLVFCLVGIIRDFPGLGRESCLSRVLVIPCFDDIFFTAVR